MKRSGFQIAGGVLEIVAGAFWLAVSLLLHNIAQLFGLKLDILQIIMPILFIIFGALACTGKRRKSEVVVFGILNLAFILLQFFWGSYFGLGIIQMVLLFIAALMFFIAPKLKSEIEYKKIYKEYVANEPRKIKTIRRVYLVVCLVLGLLFNVLLAFFYVLPIVLLVVAILSIAVPLIFGLVVNRGRKQYRLTANIIYMIVALLLCFCIQFILFVALRYNRANNVQTISQSILINDQINITNTQSQVAISEIDEELYIINNDEHSSGETDYEAIFVVTNTVKKEGFAKDSAICASVGCGVFLLLIICSYTCQYNYEVNKIIKKNKTQADINN